MELENEIQIIDRARKDPEAFGELYEVYVNRIYNYIYYRVGNVQDAEDLTSRVFFKALDKIGLYRHMGLPFSAWLYRIAHNLVANYHRDRARVQLVDIDELVLQDLSLLSNPEINLAKNEEGEALLQAISQLNEQKRELILLKFVYRLSNEQIAQAFGKTEGAIKSLYHRTLCELREIYNKDATCI